VAASDAAEAGVPAIGPAGITDRKLSILLVDDEDLVRFATSEMIRELGHSVTQASSGAEALDHLAAGGRFDVLITDYKMPRMDGAELARRVREIQPSLPILVITGYTGTSDESLDLPKLAKPFGQAEISAALAGLLASDENVIQFRKSAKDAATHQG